MDVDTRLLRYFAAVAAEGNLTRAAERLSVSQPALTKQVRQLENQLGEPFVAAPEETGCWCEYWLTTSERQGHPVRIGYVTGQPDAWLAAIASGYGIALAPESAARYYARPGIVYRPVIGVSPSQAGVAWPPANDADPVVQDFVRCCLDNKPAHPHDPA